MLALLLLLAALLLLTRLLLLLLLLLLLTALAAGLSGLATLAGTTHHHLRNCTRGRDGRGRHFLPVVEN